MGGSTGLLVGLFIMIAKKGDKRHRTIGKIYFLAMMLSAMVAIPMSYLHPNWFLFMISIFTIYMLTTGVRYLKMSQSKKVTKIDWLISFTMLLFAIGFIVYGILILLSQNNFGIVLMVFGIISLSFVYNDVQNYGGQSKIKNFHLTNHISRMSGAYIASCTAFIVVNNHDYVPGIIAWLLPTFIITPLIIKWTRKYKVLKK